MFINSLRLYSDSYIYNYLTIKFHFKWVLYHSIQAGAIQKNVYFLQYKKIIRSNKKIVFRSASSFALY